MYLFIYLYWLSISLLAPVEWNSPEEKDEVSLVYHFLSKAE